MGNLKFLKLEMTLMKKLFAAYLAQEVSADFIPGQYDPEQELWIADNQLSGAPSVQLTTTTHKQGTTNETLRASGIFIDSDVTFDTKNVPDTDSGPEV